MSVYPRGGSFGLSPRPAAQAYKQQQQQQHSQSSWPTQPPSPKDEYQKSNSHAFRESSYPPYAQQQPHPSHSSTTGRSYPPAASSSSDRYATSHSRSSSLHSEEGEGTYSAPSSASSTSPNTPSSSSHSPHSSSSSSLSNSTTGFHPLRGGSGGGGVSGGFAPRSSHPHDTEAEELRLWQKQQDLLEKQAHQYRLIKYGGGCTILTLLLLVVFLFGQQSAMSSQRGELQMLMERSQAGMNNYYKNNPVPVHQQFNTRDDAVLEAGSWPGGSRFATGGEGAEDESAQIDPLVAQLESQLVDADTETTRRILAELTARETERQRLELYDLDAPTPMARFDPNDEAVAKLNPVDRAAAVVPAPSAVPDADAMVHDHAHEFDSLFPHHEAAASHEEYVPAQAYLDEESPAMLRQLAETQRMALLEEEAAAAKAALRRRYAHSQHGSSSQLRPDDDSDYLPSSPSSSLDSSPSTPTPYAPTPDKSHHIMIEHLIHEHSIEGTDPVPHPHQEHPGVPKQGSGVPSIPMPGKPGEKKKGEEKKVTVKVEEKETVVEETKKESAAEAATPASSPYGRKKPEESSSKSTAEEKAEKVEKAPAPASSSSSSSSSDDDDEDMLSELSRATRPYEMSKRHEALTSEVNKETGMKGPVKRGANQGAVDDEEEDDGARVAQKPPKKKSSIPAGPVLDETERRVAQTAWGAMKGKNLGDGFVWTHTDGAQGTPILNEDIHLIVLTSLKQQGLARKVQALYGPLVKRMSFVSDGRDNGLNATYFRDPRPEWSMVGQEKEMPWRLYDLFSMLADPSRNPNPTKFYLVMHDQTFPLLDQIKWRLDTYLSLYKGSWPSFVGGRKAAMNYEKPFWEEQRTVAEKMYKGRKMFVVPSYIYGFSHQWVSSVSDFSNVDTCPVLPTENQALSGLVECSGGEQPQTEYDFLLQTRNNHREKRLDKDMAPVNQWRMFDAYHRCNTPGMLQEAFDAYYGKLQKKEE